MSIHDLYGILALVVGAIVMAKIPDWNLFYAANFVGLWFTVCLAMMLLAGQALRFYLKKTKAVETEGRIFEHAWYAQGPGAVLAGYSDAANLYVSAQARLGHVQILGTTGRGKTESVIIPWMIRDAQNGISSILIDGKGDPEIVAKLKQALGDKTKITVFDLGNPKSSCHTNPLAHGSPQQITDRLFASLEFNDAFYRAVQFDAAAAVVELLAQSEVVTMRRLYELLTDDTALSEATRKQEGASKFLKDRIARILATPRKERNEKWAGLISQLAPFAVGEVSALVNASGSSKGGNQNIAEMLLSSEHRSMPEIFVLLIPTLKYQAIGKQLGRMLLQQLASAVGERSSSASAKASFLPVYLDEFSAFAYQGFEQILNKARSSRIALHLSHQSMADLSIVSPDFAQIVNTNTNVKCLFGLNDPETADFYARHIGTNTIERRTERVEADGWFRGDTKTGQASLREAEEYRVHPNLLKNFSGGRGVLHMPTPDGNLTAVLQFERLTPVAGET